MITFNGIYFRDWFSRIKTISRPLIPEQLVDMIEIPNRPGAYLQNRRDGVRVITVGVQTFERDLIALQAKLDEYKHMLIVDTPAPLLFDDEPGKTYYAIVSGNTDIEQLYTEGKHEITFICLDPYAYGGEAFREFTTSAISFPMIGNKESYPKYEFTFKEDATAIMAMRADGRRFMLGLPEDVELTTVEPRQILLSDPMDSLANWTNSTLTPDGGVNAGSMGVMNGSFYPTSYGTGTAWHGPVLMRNLSESLQDFEAEFIITQNNAFRDRVGRVEIYLTNASNKVIAKLAMKDATVNYSNNHGEVRLGTLAGKRYLVDRDSDNHAWWNNFVNGKLVIRREGKRFTGRIAWVDGDGIERNVDNFVFVDTRGDYQDVFSRIHVHIGTHSTKGPTTQSVNDIKVYKLNVVNEQTVPLIAKIGDKITVDTSNGQIRKNGQLFMAPLNLTSDFFPLVPGTNNIEIIPEGKVDTRITYKPRWT